MLNDRVTITLPPDGRWLLLANNCLQDFCKAVGFSQKLYEMCVNSAMEACEELVRLAEGLGVTDPFELALESRGETIVIDITYNGRIPLNPQDAGDYELPDADTAFNDLNLDALWLHLIKKRMDRVRFMVRGTRHTLRIIKYRREEGKEKQAWIMAVTPKLRSDLLLYLDAPDAESSSGTLQAKGSGVLRLGPSEIFFIRNMDGQLSFHDLYMAHIDALGLTSPSSLAKLYEKLESMNMLIEHEEGGSNSRLKRFAKALVNPDFSIPNADAVVTNAHAILKYFYSYWGAALLVLIGISGLIPLAEHYQRFLVVLAGLEETILASPWILLLVYLLVIVHVFLHELGHGVTCKHYGGYVPRMGIMFYLASFIFYCDTTAAWSFVRKKDRILVSLVGPLVSFSVLGAALWAAGFYAGSNDQWEPIWVAFCISCAFGLVMNFNPLIKMDAYYMLLDYTGIKNLRARSFTYLKHYILNLLGIDSREDIKGTLKERRVFLWYGVLGSLMTLIFVAVPLVRLNMLLDAESVSGGRLFLAVVVSVFLVTRLGNLVYRKIKAVRHRDYRLQ